MFPSLPSSWGIALTGEFQKSYWGVLTNFIESEYSQQICFPQETSIFKALELTPFDDVRVVILGQDPYHTAGAAMGLAFSIPEGSKSQPSLRNIFKELDSDIGVQRTLTDLTDWTEQGVLLLNTVLTVRQGESASHQGQGWENFTDAMIIALSAKRDGIVFILWGNSAINKQFLIDSNKHHIITSPHPSPFSAYRGFFGSRPFSRTNMYLRQQGRGEIVWRG
ncbi:uracil-DNA glycosylase [Candidatus Gracilibacteria bacterium]|nr:uracil-DNA glycosylase [Candidatus Gracilibacteria bacterium]